MTNEEKILEILTSMQGDIAAMQGDISAMQGDISAMQGDISAMQGDISAVQGDISAIKTRLGTLERKVDEIKDDGEITREAVNKVAEWADNAGFLLKIPFGKPVK